MIREVDPETAITIATIHAYGMMAITRAHRDDQNSMTKERVIAPANSKPQMNPGAASK